MSIELFPLNASVSGSTVSLTFSTLVPSFPPLVSYTIQRKLFGRGDDWADLVAAVAPSAPSAVYTALGAAATKAAIIAGTTVTAANPSTLSGDLDLSPGSSVVGTFAFTGGGAEHVDDSTAVAAQSGLTAAYNVLAAAVTTNTVSGDIGGQTLTAGVYKSTSTLDITGTLTLDAQGDPNAVFIFQIGSTLTTAAGNSTISLVNGALASNVFWQVGSSATLGTNTIFKGSILALTSVTATTGAAIEGRLLARNGAVTVDGNTVTVPAVVVPAPAVAANTDAPGAGTWSYRVAGVMVQGGVDYQGTRIYSQEVNVTVGEQVITLVLGSEPALRQPGYTHIKLGWYPTPLIEDVEKYEIQLSVNSGPYRPVGETDEFENLNWEEFLVDGLGTLNFKVVAYGPSATPPYNAPVLVTSNIVTVSI